MQTNWIPGLVDRAFLDNPENRKKVEETRTIPFVISSSAKDRHKTVVNMKNWKLDNYNLNPIVGYQHNVYGGNMCTPDDPDNVIGSSRVWFEQRGDKEVMMGEVKFEKAEINPLAEKIFQKVLAGTLNAASVGFLELGKGKRTVVRDDNNNIIDETYFFEGQELLEWSVVNIPSNPEASSRSMRNHTRAGINFLRNMGMDKEQIRKIANEIIDSIDDREQDQDHEPFTVKGVDLFVTLKKKETPAADANLNNYQERLRKIKNEKAQTTA